MPGRPPLNEILTTTPAATSRRTADPSSSHMFSGLLNEIEEMLDEAGWERALHEALELPAIAVALCSPELRCSPERVQQWCEHWVRPADAERDIQGPDFQGLRQAILERAGPKGAGERVPLPALRHLQRSRHVRAPPRGFGFVPTSRIDAGKADAAALCAALINAARRWYARAACRDDVVQLNLARLAVLR